MHIGCVQEHREQEIIRQGVNRINGVKLGLEDTMAGAFEGWICENPRYSCIFSVHKSERKEHYYNQVAVFIRLLGKVYYYIYKGDSVELSFISFT